MTHHPDCSFIHYLIRGFTFGFHPGFITISDSSFTCHSLQSALTEPDTVDTLLRKDLKDGFMIGPFSSPPFPIYRSSPIGIATRKYSSKKRLIIDLSPHHSKHQQPHPSPDFSLNYTTIIYGSKGGHHQCLQSPANPSRILEILRCFVERPVLLFSPPNFWMHLPYIVHHLDYFLTVTPPPNLVYPTTLLPLN